MPIRTQLIGKRDPFLVRSGFADVDRRLHDRLKTQWDRAVGEFAQETAKHIHIETGMSQHALYALASRVRVVSKINWQRGLRPPRQPYQYTLDGQKTRKHKSAKAGINAGAKSGVFKINYGSPGRPVFRFEYNIPVFQWQLNENDLDFWQALKAGEDAMIAYLYAQQGEIGAFLDQMIFEALSGE